MIRTSLLSAPQRAIALWREHPRKAAGFAALALAATVAIAGSAWSTPDFGKIGAARVQQTAPAPPPLLVRNLAPAAAVAVNSDIPVASGPNPEAAPFSFGKANSATRAQALECLTSAVYYEAGNQGADGERAVAQVVLNRVRHPAFPSSVCGVVYQGSTRATGCQFTFTCDGSLERRPDAQGWAQARTIAESALTGTVFGPVGLATHYHADYVVPYWASTMAKNAVIGAHLFYRWAGSWGQASAYTQTYAHQEPDAHALRAAALAAIASRPAQTAAEVASAIPGAQVEEAPPGRVKMRFSVATLQAAKKAAADAPHEDYVEKVAASDNLRWTLTGSAPDASQKPLGRGSGATTESN